MAIFWKVIITILILYTIVSDGSRARRRRQAPMQNQNPALNSMNQPPPLGPNPQILNGPGPGPGPHPPPQGGPNDYGTAKQGGRQYYSPYQGQSGYGSIQGLNYPFAGAGIGSYQYGSGQYGQYSPYYNQYPGSSSFYGSSYNRPGGSYSSNYYPSGGYGGYGGGGYGGGGYGGGGYGGGYGGYSGYGFWNAGQKQNINMFTIFLSSLLTLVIYLITA